MREWLRNKCCVTQVLRKYVLQFHSIDILSQAKSALPPPTAVRSIFSIDYAAYSRTTLALQSSLKSIFLCNFSELRTRTVKLGSGNYIAAFSFVTIPALFKIIFDVAQQFFLGALYEEKRHAALQLTKIDSLDL